MVVGLLEECRPVGDGTAHGAHFDEIEGLGAGVEPGGFAVVDLELQIRWDPNGLYRT